MGIRKGRGKHPRWGEMHPGSRKMLSIAKVGDDLTLSMYITVVGTLSVSSSLRSFPLKTRLM